MITGTAIDAAHKNLKYYEYGDNKNEQAAKEYWEKIKEK